MNYITQTLSVPIAGSYDVIVCGGGIAGISAALSAVRKGAKVLLLEKMYFLGGLATAGLVTIYLPLCDGKGRQVSFGIAEELLRLSVQHGFEPGAGQHPDRPATAWLCGGTQAEKEKERFQVQFSANVFAIECEKILLENGVEILYGTSLCSTVTENEKIRYVITENKSGRQAFEGKSFVDATGDADLCLLSGASTALFQQKNVLAAWYYAHSGENYRLKMLGYSDIPQKYKQPEKEDTRQRYQGLCGTELSEMVQHAHAWILEDFLKEGLVSGVHALANIASIPQVRMTRRLSGQYTMNDEELFTFFEDSIGLISDWRKAGPVYELPFRTLVGTEIKNLAVCGRCISVTDDMWDITRVIPACAVTGEAAGLACALFDDFSRCDTGLLQKELSARGIPLHTGEI